MLDHRVSARSRVRAFPCVRQIDAIPPVIPSSDTNPGRGDGLAPRRGGSDYDPLRGRWILVVDDNVFNRRLATQMLEDVGVRVVAVDNGRQALDAMRTQPFDLVLMDCRMPEMDGYETTRAIRAEPRWRGVPIIAMTACILLENTRPRAPRAWTTNWSSRSTWRCCTTRCCAGSITAPRAMRFRTAVRRRRWTRCPASIRSSGWRTRDRKSVV